MKTSCLRPAQCCKTLAAEARENLSSHPERRFLKAPVAVSFPSRELLLGLAQQLLAEIRRRSGGNANVAVNGQTSTSGCRKEFSRPAPEFACHRQHH